MEPALLIGLLCSTFLAKEMRLLNFMSTTDITDKEYLTEVAALSCHPRLSLCHLGFNIFLHSMPLSYMLTKTFIVNFLSSPHMWGSLMATHLGADQPKIQLAWAKWLPIIPPQSPWPIAHANLPCRVHERL